MANKTKNSGLFQLINLFSSGEQLHTCTHNGKEYRWATIAPNNYKEAFDRADTFCLKSHAMTGFVGKQTWLLISVTDDAVFEGNEAFLFPFQAKKNLDGKWIEDDVKAGETKKSWLAKGGNQPGNLVALLVAKDKMPILHTLCKVMFESGILFRTNGVVGIDAMPIKRAQMSCEEIEKGYKDLVTFWKSVPTMAERHAQLTMAGTEMSNLRERLLADKLWLMPIGSTEELNSVVGVRQEVERADGMGNDVLIRLIPFEGELPNIKPLFIEPEIKEKSQGKQNLNPSSPGFTIAEKLAQCVSVISDPNQLNVLANFKKSNPFEYDVLMELLHGKQASNLNPLVTSQISNNATNGSNGLVVPKMEPLSTTPVVAPYRKTSTKDLPVDITTLIPSVFSLINEERKSLGLELLNYEDFLKTIKPDTCTEKMNYLYEIYQWTFEPTDKRTYLKKFGVYIVGFFQLEVEQLKLVVEGLQFLEEHNMNTSPMSLPLQLSQVPF